VSLDSLLSQLDPDPRRRGREFERICAWYLRNAPEYRGRFRKVWLWKDWPGAKAPDAGIDLVAEEHGGDRWAIQAKAYDPSYAIKKKDVDSFLAAAGSPDFSFRLLIATTDRLGPTARRTLDDQREPINYTLRSQLALAPVAWPKSPQDLRPRRPPRKKPFPHVKEAIKATVKGFKGTDRGQLLMACGTGKTLAAMWIAERLGSKRTLILLPSLSLLAQTLRVWTANASKPFDYLAVCSDETVAGEDEFVQHTAELGLPVTTDPDLIAAFLRGRGRRVVFATYHSSPQVAAAFKDRTPHFDLAIADEAHRCAGRVGNEFTTILQPDQIRSKRRLFMTATPRIYTQRLRDEAGVHDVEVASMDDPSVFGPVLHHLSFGEGIERGLLSDYQVVVVGVDDEMYRTYAERGKFITRDGKKMTNARKLAGQIGLAKSMRKYDLRRVISFHGRVEAAREFSAEMPDVITWMPPGARPAGALWSEHVRGTMTSGHRDRLLLRFRALAPKERGLLSNARCLGEGVDVPSIDGVAFIDPRRSTIDIVQALGRAIRKAPDKKLGTIVLPVFLSDEEDPELVLDESAFKNVWDVLKALRAHDEALGEEIDDLRYGIGVGSPLRLPGKVRLDIPVERVGARFVEAFNIRLVEQTSGSWEFYLGLLQRFVERDGHALVPDAHREDGYRLGQWVGAQRQWYNRQKLDPQRQVRLEAVHGWVWDTKEAAWIEAFAHLQSFVEREGHTDVSQETREDGFPLGRWVAKQRQAYRRGKLDPERRTRLEATSGWAWNALEARWEEGFAHLERFVERKGHARVPRGHREDGYPLSVWVSNQHRPYREGKLDPERRARLEALPGWTWDAKEAAWEEGFIHLQRFIEREGHARVPSSYKDDDGFKLGGWVRHQREFRRRGELSAERVRRLQSLHGWAWDPRDAAWEEGFVHLRSFVMREGHARIGQKWHEDGFALGSWVLAQRQRYRRGTLEPERRARLEALAEWTWYPHEAAWEEGFAHLERFVKREGHARVAKTWREADYRLGPWVDHQRILFRNGKLHPKRRARLEALPDWAWTIYRTSTARAA
jgi:superfamily II DNA or RNA helicase